MAEETCFIIPAEQFRNKKSEYYKKLEKARAELKTEESIKIHKMLFGLMDSVGGVREDVFEFFLQHNFECKAQVMRCMDLFSRLAPVGWFQIMFEEKSIKDTNAFPHWQEAILRSYKADIPFEQMKKMYELSFVPIDLNRMVDVYTNKVKLKMEEFGRKISEQEGKMEKKKEASESSAGLLEQEFSKLLSGYREEKEGILSELKKEKDFILNQMQEILASMQAIQKEIRADYRFYKEVQETNMRQDVAKSEEETSVRQDVVNLEEETSVRQDVVMSEEKTSMRQSVVKSEEENAMYQQGGKFETDSFVDTGIQTLNIEEEREKQIKRLHIFLRVYKKVKRKSFLAGSENEKKSELFNMLTKRKSSKDYMIIINLLMKAGIEMGVLYDFIERNTSLEELKNVLEAITSGEEERKDSFMEAVQEPLERQEEILQTDKAAGAIPVDVSDPFVIQDEKEEDFL